MSCKLAFHLPHDGLSRSGPTARLHQRSHVCLFFHIFLLDQKHTVHAIIRNCCSTNIPEYYGEERYKSQACWWIWFFYQNLLFTSNTSQINLYEQSFLRNFCLLFSLYCIYFTFICSILGPNLNDAGRGMNLIVLDSKTFNVSRIAHFDTWQNSTQNNLLNRRTYNIYEDTYTL